VPRSYRVSSIEDADETQVGEAVRLMGVAVRTPEDSRCHPIWLRQPPVSAPRGGGRSAAMVGAARGRRHRCHCGRSAFRTARALPGRWAIGAFKPHQGHGFSAAPLPHMILAASNFIAEGSSADPRSARNSALLSCLPIGIKAEASPPVTVGAPSGEIGEKRIGRENVLETQFEFASGMPHCLGQVLDKHRFGQYVSFGMESGSQDGDA